MVNIILNFIWMLEYDRMNISDEIDINKTNSSKECDICLYWYFLNKNLIMNHIFAMVFDDLMQKAMNFNDVAFVHEQGWCS